MNVLDCSVPYLKHFEEMTRIPHGSFNEKGYSNYLVEFSKKHKLKCVQYDVGSVIIYKKASTGYENHPPVILQAHIDMVCEKAPESTHNFEKDPLELYLENGCIRARNTTLGADDGAGVAYMLDILESEQIAHPPLECIFTVQEEVTSAGVEALKQEDISARRMIGLDDGGGATTFISSAGGTIVGLNYPFSYENTQKAGYRLTISGLSGGHSGPCISQEKGNAIKIAARILQYLTTTAEIQLAYIQGGAASNIIAAECTAVFVSQAPRCEMEACVKLLTRAIQKELEYSDTELAISIAPQSVDLVMNSRQSKELIKFLYLVPDGFRHKSMKINELTVASENVGVIRTEHAHIYLESHIRGALESYVDSLDLEYRLLAEQFHFDIEVLDRYPAWEYAENTPLRNLMMETYRNMTGHEIEPIAVHGGLECGYFKEKFPDMDIVSIGPTTRGMHTIEESLDLDSFAEIYKVVIAMLAAL